VVEAGAGRLKAVRQAPPFLRGFRLRKWGRSHGGLLICPPLAALGGRQGWP
jgi:hypothetical protein